MSEKIKPCPFCGSPEPQMITTDPVSADGFTAVECTATMCQAIGPAGKSEAEAIEKWNKRVQEPA